MKGTYLIRLPSISVFTGIFTSFCDMKVFPDTTFPVRVNFDASRRFWHL